ncbi:MAG: superoxide dismutase [Ni] [Ferrimonas sp.]
MWRLTLKYLLLSTILMLMSLEAFGHCQLPCGIYDDHTQVALLLEDAATIDKATTLIAQLAGKSDPQSANQLIRWVNNKGQHAQNIIDIITNYFLTQRVSPNQKDYLVRLEKHHAVILAAVKVKQQAGGKYAAELIAAIMQIAPYYPEHTESHPHAH